MTSNQGGLWDVTLEDPELEEALGAWLEDRENRAESAAINKRRKEAFKRVEGRLEPGQRVRVGGYCFEVSLTEHEAYEVEAAAAKGVRRVQRVGEVS